MATAALITGCANEAPFFDPTVSRETGRLMTSCLAPKLGNTEGVDVSTRANVPSVDDFTVVISREGNTRDGSAEGSVEYTYSDMPEVLTLPVGDYQVYAFHGDNPDSDWDTPYYRGESSFGIIANKITDDVDPIVAKLANVRVTIKFHSTLLSAMSEGNVKVNVGRLGEKVFSPSESRSAYFKYEEESSTLAATFEGVIDGDNITQSITYDNVAPGNHYTITFRVRSIEDDDPGTVNGGITVDTAVEQVDMNKTIDGEDDNNLNAGDYNDRPTQGGGEDPEPSKPDQPTPDEPKAPFANELDPADYLPDFGGTDNIYEGFDKIDLKKVNEVTDHLYCAWKVVSEAEGGFTAFTVDIISDTLTPEELEGVELTDHLDLIEPGDFEETLKGLGFPVGL
ncbi:MAG: DUF4493 domain-containing protein, partial [Muribaculaceae bacterium]|nr:DUF4493 domain-containing protein [Muribaculaceae bacterium]